jgi:hypothetical protein
MKKIVNEIHTFKGNVLCIGVTDDKILSCLNKNNNIGLYELSRPEPRKIFSKRKRVRTKSGKSVPIKKFRKIFKRKSIDYLIINLNSVYDYYKYMASNSIYVCNRKIYIYGSSKLVTANDIGIKFKRYKTKVECIQDNDDYLVIIDSSLARFNFFKEKYYLLIDTLINLGDMISYFLTS